MGSSSLLKFVLRYKVDAGGYFVNTKMKEK